MNGSLKGRIQRRITFLTELLPSKRIKVNVQQVFPFWLASLLVGLVAVGYTKLFAYAEGLLESLLAWHSWTIFIATPLCFITA